MAHLTLLCFAVIAFTVQCAVLNYEDVAQKREARSPCATCGPPSGILPPPVFHTQNWSGLARSADGLQNAVFSGAAAAANQGAQTSGEAFSLASSAVNAPAADHSDGTGYGGASGGVGISAGGKDGNLQGTDGNFHATKGGSGYGGFNGGLYKESHYSSHSGGSNSFGVRGIPQANSQDAGFGSAASSSQSGSYGASNENAGGTNHQEYSHGIPAGTSKSERFEGHGGNEQAESQQVQSSGFGSDSSSVQSGSLRGNNGNFGKSGHQYQNIDTQQTQTNGFGSGLSSSQGGTYGSLNAASDSSARQQDFKDGGDTGRNFGNEGGRFQSGTQRDQQGYGSTLSSSQGGAFGSSYGSRHGIGEGGYGSGRKQFGRDGGYQQSESQQLQSGSFGGSASDQGGVDAGQQVQTSGFGSSNFHGKSGSYGKDVNTHGQQNSGQAELAHGSYGGSHAGVSGYSSSDTQSALSGALTLASQGLQTPQPSGCSTCGKSSYALSNAKSYSGSAVALSIGG